MSVVPSRYCAPESMRKISPKPSLRLDSALAMTIVSVMPVSLRTSRTVMSRALMSSRAATAIFASLGVGIRGVVGARQAA
jgi:hypothetical protein